MSTFTQSQDRNTFSLKISSDPVHLAPTRLAIERLCKDAGFDPKTCESIGLAVNEAVANIIRHAYGGASDKPIVLNVRLSDDEITIEIRDWGHGENPDTLAPAPPNPLKPGGLGLLCMKRMMDSVVFTSQPDGMLLVLRKRKPR